MDSYNKDSFSNYTIVDSTSAAKPAVKTFMANVFLWMFAALGISAGFAFWFANSPSLLQTLINAEHTGLSMFGYVAMFAPLAFVFAMSLGFQRFSAPVLTFLFIAYAAVMGISLSFILLVYTATSVFACFLTASVTFGIMAVMGYTTNKDLTSFGRIMMMGLIGIVVAVLINIFLKSDQMSYIISIISVIVFTGLTAYDVQKLKRIGEGIEVEGISTENMRKASIFGALNLYLDFINLFLALLRIFGRKN